jgi:hypothetical protein
MPIQQTPLLKHALRLSAYLLVIACSQSTLEKYGCACASRTYTTEEIAQYKAGAARNDLKALAEMEEYHMWRGSELADGSEAKKKEEKLQRAFRVRRLTLNDPKALEDEVQHLAMGSHWREIHPDDREKALVKAIDYAKRHPARITLTDIWDPARRDIDAVKFLNRELAYAREFGELYHANRSMAEERAEYLQKRLQN